MPQGERSPAAHIGMRTAKQTRVATVKATGEQFVVINLDFNKGQVVCQPDVYALASDRARKFANVSHVNAPAQRFALDAVVIRNVPMTLELAKTLLAQSQRKVQPRVVSEQERALAAELAAAMLPALAAVDAAKAREERARRDAFEARERADEAKANR